MGLQDGHYSAFLVRVWCHAGAVIHGEAVHIATRQVIRFQDPDRLLAFIRTHATQVEEAPRDDTTDDDS